MTSQLLKEIEIKANTLPIVPNNYLSTKHSGEYGPSPELLRWPYVRVKSESRSGEEIYLIFRFQYFWLIWDSTEERYTKCETTSCLHDFFKYKDLFIVL